MWRRLNDFAKAAMPEFDDVRKLIVWSAFCLTSGIALGILYEKAFPSGGATVTLASDFEAGRAAICDSLGEISRLQTAYAQTIEPLQSRWLELTKILEKGDLPTWEEENVNHTAQLIQDQMQVARSEHKGIVSNIASSCAE